MKITKSETIISDTKVVMNVHIEDVSLGEMICLASKMQQNGFKKLSRPKTK